MGVEIRALFGMNDGRLSKEVLDLSSYFAELDVFDQRRYARVSADDILYKLTSVK